MQNRFVLLYSDKWIQSVPYFQVLCIAGLAFSLQSVNNQSIAAIGKSQVMFIWTVLKRTMGLLFVIGGLLIWGMKGLLVGAVLNTWFSYFVNISLVSKYIGYKWSEQILNILPVTIVSIISALGAYGMSLLLKLPLFFDGIVKAFVFCLIYFGWSLLFKPESFMYFRGIVEPMIKRLNHKKSKFAA